MRVSNIGRWFRVLSFVWIMLCSINLWATPCASSGPCVLTPPQSTTILGGATATFTATGSDFDTTTYPTVSYQWQYYDVGSSLWVSFSNGTVASGIFNGATVSNADSSSITDGVSSPALTLTNVPVTASGVQIHVLVTDSSLAAVSSVTVTLTVDQNWWQSAGTLNSGVSSYVRGALLANHQVMTIGNDPSNEASTTINLDTTPGVGETPDTWASATPTLPNAVVRPTTTLLPTGDVLIAGGLINGGNDQVVSYLYTYGSSAGTVPATTNSLNTARDSHTASLLYTGKVMVTGGNDNGLILNSAELYDPASQTWTATSTNMHSQRYRHAATVLWNGKVLVTGGQTSSTDNTSTINSAEIYDPVANTWTTIASMNTARAFHTSTLLPNGDVLIAGGINSLGQVLKTAEIFDHTNNTFYTVTGQMAATRNQHTATLMASNLVLIAGGSGGSGNTYEATSEYFNPVGSLGIAASAATRAQIVANGVFAWTTTSLNAARDRHAAFLLANGKVLAVGGTGASDFSLATAEKFEDASEGTPSTPNATVTANEAGVIMGHSGYSASCGPVNGSGLTTQSGVTFAWTITPASLISSISYPNYPDTSTINFSVGTSGTPPASLGLSCLATSSLGIPTIGSTTVPVFLLPAVTITNNTAHASSANPTIAQGGTITFTANPSGGVPASYTYQWQYQDAGVWVNWGTAQTQVLSNALAASNGLPIQVLTTNSAGTVTTSGVTLYVVSAPSIVSAAATPASYTSSANGGTPTNAGQTTLLASATGTGTISYQWCSGLPSTYPTCAGGLAAGASVVVNPTVGGVYPYYVIVTDTSNQAGYGTVTSVTPSAEVDVTVNSVPSVSIQNVVTAGSPIYGSGDGRASLSNATVTQGSTITFTAIPGGSPYPASGYTYQWQYRDNGVWTNWGTASTQTLSNVQAFSNNLPIQVAVTNAAGATTSSTFTLYVVQTPTITLSATSLNVMSTGTASFTDSASAPSQTGTAGPAANTVAYQWCTGTSPSTTVCTAATDSGNGTATLSPSPSALGGGVYNYYLQVTNTLNSVSTTAASADVTLTVNATPVITVTNTAVNGGAASPTILQGGNITFTAGLAGGYPSSGYLYQWQYQDNGVWTNWGSVSSTNTQPFNGVHAFSNNLPIQVLVTNSNWPGYSSATPFPATNQVASDSEPDHVTLYVVATPTITMVSTPQNVMAGSTPTISDTATPVSQTGAAASTNTVSYQWCVGATPITTACTAASGGSATTATYSPSTTTGGVYNYFLQVTNTLNSVTNTVASADVTVTVNAMPLVTLTNTAANGGPATPTILQGGNITFTAGLTGGYPSSGYLYQWQYQDNGVWTNWGSVSSTNTQPFNGVHAFSNNLPIQVLVTNSNWPGYSSATPFPATNQIASDSEPDHVTLYVVATPTITMVTTPQNVMQNSSPTISDTATPISQTGAAASTNTVSYQWCVGATPITTACTAASGGSATTATYSPSTTTGGVYNYFLQVTNTLNTVPNTVASAAVTVTVNAKPVVTVNNNAGNASAVSPTILQGGNVTFTAALSGSPYPATGWVYQWQYQDNGVWTNWGTASTQVLSGAHAYSNNLPVQVLVTNTNWPSYNAATPFPATNQVASNTDEADQVTLYVVATPTFTTSPATSQNVMSTDSPSLSATSPAITQTGPAASSNTVTYNWCVGQTPTATPCSAAPGATNSLTYSPSVSALSGPQYYFLQITNTLNSVANTVASTDSLLTVNVVPTLSITNNTDAPSSTTPTYLVNSSALLTASLSGGYPAAASYVYQWQYQGSGGWTNWGTASTEGLSPVHTYSDNLPIRVIATNTTWPGYTTTLGSTNKATSGTVTLYVVAAPTGVTAASSQTVVQGASPSFTVTGSSATVGETLTYAWYKVVLPSGPDTLIAGGATASNNGSSGTAPCGSTYVLSGSGNSTLAIDNACIGDAGTFYAIATNTGSNDATIHGSLQSNNVTLGVNAGQWTAVGSTLDYRSEAMSLMLPNGNFWVAGGKNDTVGILNDDAIYTPTSTTSGTWLPSAGGNPTFVAGSHMDGTATLLADADVLIAGGSNALDGETGIEFYNYSTGSYSTSNQTLTQPTTQHVAALLPTQKVLLAGGQNGDNDTYYNTAYLFTPGATPGTGDSLAPSTGTLSTARANSRAVTLNDGRILITGGEDINGFDNAVDIYDTTANKTTTAYPTALYSLSGNNGDFFAQGKCTNLSSPTPCMQSSRIYHTATLLNDGRVLIAGGENSSGTVQSSIEIWDPAANASKGGFSLLASSGHQGTLATARLWHSAVLLADGKVLIFGGTDGSGNALNTAEVIDPNWVYNANSAPTPSTPASNLNEQRALAASTLLPNGTVLTAGGYHAGVTDPTQTENTAEVWNALEGLSTAPTAMTNANLTVATGELQNTSGNSASVSAAAGNNLNLYGWSIQSPQTIDSGQGTASISFTTGTAGTYWVDVLVNNQWGISTLLTKNTTSIAPCSAPTGGSIVLVDNAGNTVNPNSFAAFTQINAYYTGVTGSVTSAVWSAGSAGFSGWNSILSDPDGTFGTGYEENWASDTLTVTLTNGCSGSDVLNLDVSASE